MSNFERKWWFSTPVTVLSGVSADLLMAAAGAPFDATFNIARFAIFACCFVALYRAISFCAWLMLIWIVPDLVRTKPDDLLSVEIPIRGNR